ncbi:c-type cytochrome biogenesis protein CcsB [Thermosulfuriphilus ammonigenes]|uniref:C-type cytochrome biogenesis protein CcsB n=1 Tax=Thermosulfuriphilus ammonigenes TaxID=1936021 RepID=A0A6G7PXV3_9BACT|nr:c-type cytochrome biogenesis protein CcsB [Thermosulfuriphilus ammonigenes]MBA2849620.1 cytochrome c-type biogenesis protein CcsB [Thermosulfuriphilus ammonigenes]QIJ72278.1 c-type cytochrome biogenesis protein CcsB [Thermosulfuriphilus ammonigenes]
MTSAYLLSVVTFIYLVAAIVYLVAWIFKQERLGIVGTVVTIVGVILHIAGIGLRWHESHQLGIGRAPLTNMYESLVFFALTIALVYLFVEYKTKNRVIGAFATPFAFFSMAYASFGTSSRIDPLIPALQSNWLIAHVVTCFIGYASFAVACGLGIMYLLKSRAKEDKGIWASLPSLRTIDDLIYKTTVFGFLWLTAGIITGAVWAEQAWGSYWSWDPKETWSLITWFVYATAIHARFVRGWAGKRIAIISIVGFASVIFTYFGVNYLLSGLHSYAN